MKFGANWVTLALIPKLNVSLNQTKISYLLKMCILNCLAVHLIFNIGMFKNIKF
jgi:hypothetical protein